MSNCLVNLTPWQTKCLINSHNTLENLWQRLPKPPPEGIIGVMVKTTDQIQLILLIKLLKSPKYLFLFWAVKNEKLFYCIRHLISHYNDGYPVGLFMYASRFVLPHHFLGLGYLVQGESSHPTSPISSSPNTTACLQASFHMAFIQATIATATVAPFTASRFKWS